MLTNKIFNASALEAMFRAIYAFWQRYLYFLANLNLLTIKCQHDYYQI